MRHAQTISPTVWPARLLSTGKLTTLASCAMAKEEKELTLKSRLYPILMLAASLVIRLLGAKLARLHRPNV